MIELIRGWRSHWLIVVSARIGSGAALVAMANAASTLSVFAVTIAIGRLSGASELGRYGLLVALGSFVGGIVDFGTDRILAERLGQRSPTWVASLWSVVWLKGCAVGLGLAIGLITLVAGRGPFPLLIFVQAASLTAMLTTQAMAAALQRLPALAIVRIGTRLAALLGIGATVILLADARHALTQTAIMWIAVADVAAAVVVGAYALRPALAGLDRQLANPIDIRSAIREGLPLGFSSLAVWLYVKLDTLILAAVSDLSTVGVYTAAVRLAEVLGGIPTALNSVILPALARAWSEDQRRFRLMRDTLLGLTTTGLGLVCLVVFLQASPIVNATYHLPNSAPYLKILVWGQVFAACGVVCNAALQVSKQVAALAHIAIIVGLVSIPVYLGLITSFGGIGAAIGTAVLYFAILPAGLLLRASRNTYIPLLVDTAILAFGLAMAFATLEVASHFGSLPRIVQVPVASLAYLAFAVLGYALMVTRAKRVGHGNR